MSCPDKADKMAKNCRNWMKARAHQLLVFSFNPRTPSASTFPGVLAYSSTACRSDTCMQTRERGCDCATLQGLKLLPSLSAAHNHFDSIKI
jgi:hypothetical protein